MYKNIKDCKELFFSGCGSCSDCCNGRHFSFIPLVLEDFVDVFLHFPILFGVISDELRALAILSHNDRGCRYLNIDGFCSIYENRPPSCRTYPISPYFSDFFIDIACPAVGQTGVFLSSPDKIGTHFTHKRNEDFMAKYSETKKFLASIENELKKVGETGGIELFVYNGNKRNNYINAHLNSQKLLHNGQQVVYTTDTIKQQKLFSDALYG